MKRFLRNHFLLFLFRERCKFWRGRKISLISSWIKELNPIKITSVIVINCILVSFVCGESIGQAVQMTLSTQQFEKILTEFSLPQAYGKITESKYGGSDTVVINIQDLHLSAEVQKNIGNIIELFDKKYGVKNVYMEGGYGGVDTSWLSGIKNKKEKEETIRSLVSTGMLTGGEYYAAISNRPNIIKGLEKKEAYLENLKRFGNILSEENEIGTIIGSIEKDIENLKDRYFNKRQIKVEKLGKEYSEGKISAKKYYGIMTKYGERYGIDISPEYGETGGMAYKNIARYIELLKESEKINYGQTSKELEGLILKLKEVLPYQAYKMITEETANFQNVDKLYTFLIKFSKELNIDLAIQYPNLNKLFKQIEQSRQINPIEMIKEEERFEGELNIAFASDQGSREVAFLAGFIGKIKDYFSTKITADNYEWYKGNIKEWKRLYIKYIDNKKLEMLKEYEKALDKFYDINVDRNQYFIDNLEFIKEAKKVEEKKEVEESEVEKVIGSLKEAKSVNVVVTGGFHTEALSEMLGKEGISYIVITPNVSKGVEEAERAYHELAKEQSKILVESLATQPLSQIATIEGKLVGLARVLIEKNYGTQEINDALRDIGSKLEEGTKFTMVGDVKKEEEVTIRVNDKIFIRNSEGVFVEQRRGEEAARPLEKSLKSAGMTALVSFIMSNISFVFLFLIPFMSWALPFMIIPLALLIPCGIVVFFEFWQQRAISNAQLKINELVPSEIQEGEKRLYILNKLLSALPQGFRSQVEDLIELKDDMKDGVVMHYDNTAGKIYINTRLARQLFFDDAGKNVKNEVLLGSFLDHELAHREFANPENRFRFFIHNNFRWLEEFLVSYGDAFRPLQTMPSEEIVDNLLREHNAWISDNFGTIFPDGLEGLRSLDIEKQVNDAIQGADAPEALKELSSFLRMRLIREYFERKKAPQVPQGQQLEEEKAVESAVPTEQLTATEVRVEQSELEIEPIPMIQEETIDIDPKVEAFARLVTELPFEMQHSFVRAVLGNDALTARFIRIITTSDETKWKKELSGTEISVTDITEAIKASFTLEQGTMRTTEDGKIEFNLQNVKRSLNSGRSGIISLTVKSMRELDHISYIEAKDFKGFKNRLKAFIHRRLGFLERTQTFIAGLWRFVSLHITTSSAARKFTTEWAGVSVTWIPPYGIDLPGTLQDARIDDEGKLIEPFVLYGKQRFAGNRRGTITRIVRVTYKDGRQAYLRNFKPGQKLENDIAAVEISYNFESETCTIHFDMGNIDEGFVSPHPLITGIRNHDVGKGYHVDGFGNTLPARYSHNLLGCRYVTMSGKIITISKEGLENGFDIAGEELSGDLSIQLIWEPIVHVVNVEFYDQGNRQELKRGRQQVKVIAGHNARIKGFAPGIIDAAANWVMRFCTGFTGNRTGVTTHTITWAKLPEGLSFPDNYNTFGLTEDFTSSIEEGVTLETPPMRLGHIMLPNGRIGTVRCKVIDVNANQEITDFQMGKTPVDKDLRIEYEFTPDKAEYSLNFEANGGTLDEQPNIEVNNEGQAVIPKNTAPPTRAGYIFKGYQIVKCSHISLFNISITDEYEYMTISSENLQDGITLGGIVGDLVLVAQWEKVPTSQEQVTAQEETQEQTQATQPNLFLKALKFVFVNIIFWKVLVPFARTMLNAARGKYGKILQILAWVSIVGVLIWLVNRLIMHPTRTMLKIAKIIVKFYIIFAGFGYLNKLEKVLFITSLATVFLIIPVLSTFIASPYLVLILFLSLSCITYSEFKMKTNWWNWAKRTFGKVFKFIFLASGKTFRKSLQIAKIAAGEPIKYAINLYDNMSNIADNLSEIPAREGYEFGGLKIVKIDGTEKVFTVEDMKSDFVVPHEFFDGTNTIQFEYVWLTEMKASFLPGTNAEVQNVPQEIKKGVLRGKKFEFDGFRQKGMLNAIWDPGKYTLPTRAGYDFDGLVIKIEGQEEQIVKDRDAAMAGFEISEELMTGPVSFEIKWKAQEVTAEEEEGMAEQPAAAQVEEPAQPRLEQREEEIGEIVLPKEIETFARLVRELPFDIQYRLVVAVFGIDNMPLIAKFIGSISTPTGAWRRNLFKQQAADREKILDLLKHRSNALQPMAATEDGRIILNLDKINDLLAKNNRQGIRSLIVQATSELDRLPYMEASRAITEAQRAAENAEAAARIAKETEESARKANYEARTFTDTDAEKTKTAQKTAKAAEKAKAKAEAAARIAKETAEAVTTSTKIRAFIHNNLRFLETFIIFISSVFVRMTLTVKTSAIARKFTTEWGDVSVTWIPPEGLELQDSAATATIDEQGRLIEPAVIYGKQKLAGNRRGTVQRIVRITDHDGNLKYLDNFQTGDKLPERTKAVEVFYNFIPDTCKIRLDMGAIDAQGLFESRPLVKGIGDHKVGMGYHVDGFGSKGLPVRTGYKLLGCRYITMNGQIVYIPLNLLKKGFDITGQELSGDLNIQLIWEPNVSDVKVQFFDGEVKQALEGNIKVVQGHGARIKGLAPGKFAAFANWIRRLGTGLAAKQSGVKTHKISWAKLPTGLDWPDNYQTDGLNEDFISNIEDDVVLEEPPMRTGRIMLVDGRVATVVCEVTNATTGELLKNFQFGKTPVKGNLRIQYRIIEEEQYSLHFEANGGTLESQPRVNYDRKQNVATVQASNIPTRSGYVFKGYKAIKCTHQTVLGVSLGDDRYETKNIDPADVQSGFLIDNVFGEVVLVAQWEKEQTLVTREQQPMSKGFILLQALTAVWAVVKGAWGHLSTRQKITFVFAVVILLATAIMSFLLTYGIIAISFSFFISVGLYIIGGIASLILARLIYVMIKGFLLDMLKAIGNFLIKSFKLIVLAGGKTFRRSYRVTRQVFRAPINYVKNFYENMANIADNLSGIPTREGYEFVGFSVTNNTGETAEFSLEEIKRDFIVPGKYFSTNEQGEHIVKLNYIWLPKVTITTGTGTNLKGNKTSVELSSTEINLAEYKDLLIPPEGYDYTSLYWTCDAYPDRKFLANETVKLDKVCTFTPNWKPLPKATISVGKGTWKNTHGEDTTKQRPVTVTATRQGAMANLRALREAFEAPDDCDPDSLYFTEASSTDPIEENESGEVLMKSDTLYTPHWKTLAESNKVKLKIGKEQSIILTADIDGFIDLDAVVRERGLKPPPDFTEKSYWIANGEKDTKLTGKIDIKHTSVLTLHWEAFDTEAPGYGRGESAMFDQEATEEMSQIEVFPEYPIEYISGVELGAIDDVTPNLDKDLRNFFKSKKLPKGEKFTFSFKKKTPTRTGYRFKGVRVQVGGYTEVFLADEKINISGNHIKGPIKMTMLWDKEFPVTFNKDNGEAPQVLDNLKVYEGEDLFFPGFKGKNGYTIPTRDGFKFRGVRVKIGDREEEHSGMDAFTISKNNITDTITMTVLWDEKCTVKVEDTYLSPILKDLKIYRNNDLSFPGFKGRNGYTIPTRDGFKFRGVRVKVGNFDKTYGQEAFDIPGEKITGDVTITALWDKEVEVTFADAELSNVVKDLKAYQNNDFLFKGFFHDIPTKDGFKFKGVKVRIGDHEEQHLGTSAFLISKDYITGPVTITALWDKEVKVTFADAELSNVVKDLKAYQNNDFLFKGFGPSFFGAGYDIPRRDGYRFKGVKVQVGKHVEEHESEAFIIHNITGDVTITALWEKEYSVTFTDMELPAVLGDLKAYQNNDFQFKGFGGRDRYPIPIKTGFRFKGVKVQIGEYVEEHGNEPFTIPKENITGDVTITALWEKEYSVTSTDTELSTVLGDLKAYENNDFKFPGFGTKLHPIPTKLGFKFKGAKVQIGDYVEEHGNEPFTIPNQYITGPVTMTAIWEAHSPITFNKDNTEEMSEIPEGEFYYEGETFHFKGFNTASYHIRGYKLPTKAGYKFIGVKVQNGNEGPKEYLGDAANAGFDITVKGPIEITYLWEEASHVTFNTDGGSATPQDAKHYYKGDNFHFRGFGGWVTGYATSTKAGYKFIGVKVQNGNEGPKEYLGDAANAGFDITVQGDISITYLWEEASPITVDFGNGEEAQALGDITKFKNDIYRFPGVGKGSALAFGLTNGLPLPERPGYKFLGVKVNNNGVETDHKGSSAFDITVQGPIQITYLWEKASPITFDTDNGGEAPKLSANEFYYKDETFHFKGFGGWSGYAEPKREGFKFRGVKIQNGTADPEEHLGNAAFDITVQGPIQITYLWEEASPITFDTDNGGEAPKLSANEFYYKDETFHFKGFGGWSGYAEPKREGFKFRGVKIQNGTADPEEHLGNAASDITVKGPIQITYLWDEDYHVTLGEQDEKAPIKEVFHKGDKYHFVGFGSKTLGYWPIPTKTGYKFKGISVKNGNEGPKEYLNNNSRAIFDIIVQGPITITYLWEKEAEQQRGKWFKSEESAQGAAQAAAEIGMLLGTQAAGSMFVANGPLELMKNAMGSFAALERSQVIQISEAQTLVSQNNYFKGKTNEEVLRQLLSNSELSPENASMFLNLLSDVEIETSGEVMSYEPNTQDPSKPGKMHVNYKMLRAMFLDANGKTKNIELFKVFVKHELTHMEFATSNNPLYKAAHNIPFLEEFLVSFSDLYVWQQAQLILPEYTNVVKFIFTNARLLSIAAGISIEEAERISKLYTGLPQREMAIELLPTVQGKLSGGSTSEQTSKLRPLSLFVANASDGSLTSASNYADKFGGCSKRLRNSCS